MNQDVGRDAARLMTDWLDRRLAAPARDWLAEATVAAARAEPAILFTLIGQAARQVGRDGLGLSDRDMAEAESLRPGWQPAGWSADQAARLVLLLVAPGDGAAFARRLAALCSAADVGELVAWYQGLPLYPDPPRHAGRAAEGVRSNMRAVFEAVAQRNPYPSEQLDDGAFNQMVLKAVFLGSPLHLIHGLDHRANPALGRMLRDCAAERLAAGRAVDDALWSCVALCGRSLP